MYQAAKLEPFSSVSLRAPGNLERCLLSGHDYRQTLLKHFGLAIFGGPAIFCQGDPLQEKALIQIIAALRIAKVVLWQYDLAGCGESQEQELLNAVASGNSWPPTPELWCPYDASSSTLFPFEHSPAETAQLLVPFPGAAPAGDAGKRHGMMRVLFFHGAGAEKGCLDIKQTPTVSLSSAFSAAKTARDATEFRFSSQQKIIR